MSPESGAAPSLLSSLGLTLIGLLLLAGGGEALVHGAAQLARRFGLSQLLIGLTVVAFGTSLPELFVSMTAAGRGLPDLMIGNVLGSNIANVGLILGVCGLIAPLRIGLTEVWLELLLVLLMTAALMVAAALGGFPRLLGLAFAGVLVGYTAWAYHHGGLDEETGANGPAGGPFRLPGRELAHRSTGPHAIDGQPPRSGVGRPGMVSGDDSRR